jgi:hypothetical protein
MAQRCWTSTSDTVSGRCQEAKSDASLRYESVAQSSSSVSSLKRSVDVQYRTDVAFCNDTVDEHPTRKCRLRRSDATHLYFSTSTLLAGDHQPVDVAAWLCAVTQGRSHTCTLLVYRSEPDQPTSVSSDISFVGKQPLAYYSLVQEQDNPKEAGGCCPRMTAAQKQCNRMRQMLTETIRSPVCLL